MMRKALWGCDLDDYCDRFNLTKRDFLSSILEYGCGVSALNSDLLGGAGEVISCDPWFNLDLNLLIPIVEKSFAERVLELGASATTTEAKKLIVKRRKGMQAFFDDYESGRKDARYCSGTTEQFTSFRFDLALSHQFFFVDDAEFNIEEHVTRLFDLARVAKEVRLFPLNDNNGRPSELLGPVLLALQQANYGTEIQTVKSNFQSQGNAMLRVFANSCDL